MKFDLSRSIEILSQTPYTLARMLEGLSPEWTQTSGDQKNWAPFDVLGHLIHGEEVNWIPRAEIIVVQGDNLNFVSFERLAQFDRSNGRSLTDLLTEFAHLRITNIERLARWELTPEQLALKGIHPEFGEVTLEQLIATWVVHDLNHIRQIAAYMANQYAANVGPWKQYLKILDQ